MWGYLSTTLSQATNDLIAGSYLINQHNQNSILSSTANLNQAALSQSTKVNWKKRENKQKAMFMECVY